MHDGLRDLRSDAADDAVRTHEARCRYGLEKMLRGQRVDGRDAGDIDDRYLRAFIDNVLQQVFHDHLRALAVERANDRKR